MKGETIILDYIDIKHMNNKDRLEELNKVATSKFINTYNEDWNAFSQRFTSKKSVWEFAHNYLSLNTSLDVYYYRHKRKQLKECVDSLLEPKNLRIISAILNIDNPDLIKVLNEYDALHEKVQKKEYNDAYARYRMKR